MNQAGGHQRELTRQLEERQRLLEKLTRIQRSISHRAPLQEVLDAITAGASELLSDDVAGLRIIDPDDPTRALLVSAHGVDPALVARAYSTPLRDGVGGRAIIEQRLLIVDDYEHSDVAIGVFAEDRLQTAMGAPVYENGEVAGSLTVASHTVGRRYSESEQEMLLALADHASLALTDAKIVESMREAQRAKDMFLAMVSHELKTPLTVIMGILQMLRTKGDLVSASLRDQLIGTAHDRGEELTRLIDMLLKGARAQLAGDRQVNAVPTLLYQAVAGFRATRTIEVGDVPEVNAFVDGDALQQVIGILVENAIAHSPDGSPVLVETDTDGDRVCISVSNVGAFPAGFDAVSLFAPFHRGASATSSGVGLGLYVAARLAASMDGQIDARAADGRVTFTFSCDLGLQVQPQFH